MEETEENVFHANGRKLCYTDEKISLDKGKDNNVWCDLYVANPLSFDCVMMTLMLPNVCLFACE